MKAVLVLFKNSKLVRRERRFLDWKAYEAFLGQRNYLAALSQERWARVYRSGA
ncbi:hypothetical protein TthTF19_21090 (plasmid) [Thermus thermophilus]|uniref:Uncharacterized protein n=1 Tax=Thermus thermophilus TaxID=274 RepID=A0AAD1KW46_THETH|nr:hypothetical protein [Thermus thermophilus]BCZ88004.1 hypothetical protein TthAA11_21860 [Thermus thermophilus]BCZ95649.1 hypothetical protein TthAK1_22660 [Thermus thermophilus]